MWDQFRSYLSIQVLGSCSDRGFRNIRAELIPQMLFKNDEQIRNKNRLPNQSPQSPYSPLWGPNLWYSGRTREFISVDNKMR